MAIFLLGAEVVAIGAVKAYRYYRWLCYSEPFAIAPHAGR